MEIENWTRLTLLHFRHEKFGEILRTEFGEWEQTSAEGFRKLKSETLKDALVEAEKEYKKPKVRKPKKTKTEKIVKDKPLKKASKKLTIKKAEVEVPKKKQQTKKTSKAKKKATVVKRKRKSE